MTKTTYDIERGTNELLRDLKQLVEIPSVHDEHITGSSIPSSKEIRNATDVFLQIAQQEGFSVHDFDDYAVNAQLGERDGYIGVLAHLDVMEAGERFHWHGDLFQVQEIGGVLYSRGVNGDKGPLLVALYAMTHIGRKGHALYHPIRLIVGGAEETTWECMEYYPKHNPQPIFGFSPDGNFPIVSGEKGTLQVYFLLNADPDTSLHCKECLYIVYDDSQVVVPKGSDVSLAERTNLIEAMQDGIKITYRGIRALSRSPQRGDNAIFKFVKDFHGHLDQAGSLYPMVNMIHENFPDDFYGRKSGLYHEDAVVDCDFVCLMSLNTQDEQLELCVDVRYVRSTDEQGLLHTLCKAARHYGCELEVLRHKRSLYIVEDSTLIQNLKAVYHKVMKEDTAVFIKRGVSYARVLERGVVFGVTFPDEDPRPHMPNECMFVRSLLKASNIYYEILVRPIRTKR